MGGRSAVENLWKGRGSAVHKLRHAIFFFVNALAIRRHRPFVVQLSHRASLARPGPLTRILSRVEPRPGAPSNPVTPVVFNEVINGRPYVIEVQPVGRDRWRACLARRGATTAVMPFYGQTPDEAARQLTVWLNRASGPRKDV